MIVNDTLKLDVHKNDSYKYVYAKQYDTNTRFVHIALCDNDIPLTIEDGIIARVRGTKPDNKSILIDGSISNNVITIKLTKEMLNVAGRVACDIGLYKPANTGNPKDDELLSTALFYIIVEKSAYDEKAVMSSNEFQTLVELIAENRILGERLQEKMTKAESLIAQMEQLLNK